MHHRLITNEVDIKARRIGSLGRFGLWDAVTTHTPTRLCAITGAHLWASQSKRIIRERFVSFLSLMVCAVSAPVQIAGHKTQSREKKMNRERGTIELLVALNRVRLGNHLFFSLASAARPFKCVLNTKVVNFHLSASLSRKWIICTYARYTSQWEKDGDNNQKMEHLAIADNLERAKTNENREWRW